MESDPNIHSATEVAESNSEVERLLAEVASRTAATPFVAPVETAKPAVKPYDVKNATLLSPRQLRKFKFHQDQFASDARSRLAQLLRAELVLKVDSIQTASYQRMSEAWPDSVHLTLFKLEPLRGVCLVQMAPRLALTLVDRLLGGTGATGEVNRQPSDIENGLLEQIVQVLLAQWAANWASQKELKPVVLGYETSPRFVQSILPQTNMLAIFLTAEISGLQEQIQLAVPFASVESLIRQLAAAGEVAPEPLPAAPTTLFKWNPCFDDVRVNVSARWQELELPAGDVLKLKVGDVLRFDPQHAQKVAIRIGDLAKFHGRLGTLGGNWAIEVTAPIQAK